MAYLSYNFVGEVLLHPVYWYDSEAMSDWRAIEELII